MKETAFSIKELENIFVNFGMDGCIISAEPIKTGHINDTLCVNFRHSCGKEVLYTVQNINTYVFKKPEIVMSNIMAVTEYLRSQYEAEGIPSERRVLEFFRTKDGCDFYRDENGRCWRIYKYIDKASTYNNVSDLKLLCSAGKAFGDFQKRLSSFPMDKLQDTIPDFHNTPSRYEQLKNAIEKDPVGRASSVRDEIEFFKEREEAAGSIYKLQLEGKLPLRVTHNDTKYNNVLIDNESREAVCIIDLDTVMPGLSVHDFGDAIRFATASAEEDEKDLSKVYMNIDSFDAFSKGFISTVKGFLNQYELDNMVMGAKLMTLECAVRFLTDYINGDVYFKTAYPDHNLDRARTQIKLVSDMENKEAEMQSIIKKYSNQ